MIRTPYLFKRYRFRFRFRLQSINEQSSL